MAIHCEDSNQKCNRASGRPRLTRKLVLGRRTSRRSFTMVELAIAAALFLLAAAILGTAVAEAIAVRAEATNRRIIESELTAAESQMVTGPGAYNALLANTFTPPNTCSGQVGTGTSLKSCLSTTSSVWQATWSVALGSDSAGVSAQTASSLTLTGTVTLPSGTSVQISRLVNAPSYAYAPGQGVVRVRVTDPGGLLTGPIYLLNKASPSVVETSAPVTNGVAVLRTTATSCTAASPCVIGLTSGNTYGVAGNASLLASQITGPSSTIVMTAGQAVGASATLRGIGTSVLTLSAVNASTTQSATNPTAGSVCLYAEFNDGVANQVAPVCNFTNAESITMYDYAPDSTRPTVRIPFPVGTPITLTADPPSGPCPWVANPADASGTTGLVGVNGTTWSNAAVCTSWTWGTPASLTVGGTTTPWSSAAITLTAGSTSTGSVNWAGTGTGANLYVTDTSGALRSVSPSGVTTTVTTSGITGGGGMATDSYGNVYTAQTASNVISVTSPSGTTTVLAGSGTAGLANATLPLTAQFHSPTAVALNPAQTTLYVADAANNVIRSIALTGAGTGTVSAGAVTTQAATGATVTTPNGVVVDSSGNLYIASAGTNTIVKDTSGGTATVFAGSGVAGELDGTGAAAKFNGPGGLAIDSSGTLYVADATGNTIRTVTSTGVVTTLAGSGVAGYADATGLSAQFSHPDALAVASNGTLYVADTTNNRIRVVSAGGVVTTLAGSGAGAEADGTGTGAAFNTPMGVTTLGGWSSGQPALGFGPVAVWSMPRQVPACASTASCVSLGTTVPENTDCPGSACYAADVPYLYGPEIKGMNAVAVNGASGVATNFSLVVADYTGTTVTVSSLSTLSMGTLKTGSGGALPSSWTLPVGGGAIALQWSRTGVGSWSGQTWFTVTMNNGYQTVSYPVAIYSSAHGWNIVGTGATVNQGGSTSLTAAVTSGDGTPSSGDATSWACATSCPGITLASSATTSAGVATDAVTVANSTLAGSYAVHITGANTPIVGTAILTVKAVTNGVSVGLSPTSISQGGNTTATATVVDKAGVGQSGVGVSFTVLKSGLAEVGVYPTSVGCTTGAGGTCAVPVTAETTAVASSSYSVRASAASFTSSASLAVTQAPHSLSVTPATVSQGGTASLSIIDLDGTGVAIPGRTVTFTSTRAGLTAGPSTTTSSSGTATATVAATSSVPAGTYTMSAVDGAVVTPFLVTVSPAAATLSGSAFTVCEGCTGTTVVTARDGSGVIIPNQVVGLTSSLSGVTVVSGATTSAGGTATLTISVAPWVATGTHSGAVTASTGSATLSLAVVVTSGAASAVASGSVAQASGTTSGTPTSTNQLTVTVYDGVGAPLSGANVAVASTNAASVATYGSAVTNSSGQVTVLVGQSAPLVAGIQSFRATVVSGGATTVFTVPFVVTSVVSSVVLSPTSITIHHGTNGTVTATLADLDGQPAVGMAASIGGSLSGTSTSSNSSGQVTITILDPGSTAAGSYPETVTVGGVSASLAVTVT